MNLFLSLILDAVVTIVKYNKSRIDHDIFIEVFSDWTVSCITVSTDDVFSTTNNKTEFSEIRIVFEESFDIKFQEGYVLKCLNLLIWKSPLGFSVYQTDHIMELVN